MTTAPEPRRGRPSVEARLAATLLATTTTIAPFVIFGFIAFYVHQFRCNENCGVTTGPAATHGWSHFRDGYEWGLHFWLLAVPTLVALAAYVVYLARGRPRRALAAVGLAALGFLAWVYFPVVTGGARAPRLPNLEHSGPRFVAVALVVWLLGTAASIAAELVSARSTTDGDAVAS